MEAIDLRRPTPRILVIKAAEAGVRLVPLALVFSGLHGRLSGIAATMSVAFVWLYTATKLWSIAAEWLTVRYSAGPQGIRIQRGILSRADISLSWADVSAVQFSHPVVHRALECCVATFAVDSSLKVPIRLEAVPESETDAMTTWHREARAASTTPSPLSGEGDRLGVESDADATVYAIRRRDYLVMSVTYGQFIVVVPMIASLYLQASEVLPMPALDALGWARDLGTSLGSASGAVGLLLLAAALGTALAWVRYQGFTTIATAEGLTVRGGLLTHERRRITSSYVRGVKVEQNPMMRLTGQMKLSVIMNEAGAKLGSNVVLPVADRITVAACVTEFFPAYRASTAGPRRGWSRADGILFAGHVAVLLSVGLASRVMAPALASWVIAVVALGQLVIANGLWTAVEIAPDRQTLAITKGFIWVRRYVMDVSAVHGVTVRSGPVGRRVSAANMGVFFLDDGLRSVQFVGVSASSAHRVADLVSGVPDRCPLADMAASDHAKAVAGT